MAGTKQGNEKRKIYRVIDNEGNYTQVLPETSAEQVTVDNTSAGITATNVQTAIKELKINIGNAGKVKSVNGKTGDVTLTASDVDALSDTTKYGKSVDLTYTSSSGVLNIALKDQDGTQISSDNVNLPKEMFVESGTVEECTIANQPVQGYEVGDKYIDLILNSGTHIYILVSDLIDIVTLNVNGTGNVISNGEASGNVITLTKGITAVTKVNGHTGADVTVTKSDLSLNNVDNTHDKDKNVLTATKLKDARNIALSGDVTGSTDFDGSGNVTISSTLANITTAKSSAKVVTYNAKGLVTGGGNIIEFGTTSNNTPSSELVVGGIFFEKQ